MNMRLKCPLSLIWGWFHPYQMNSVIIVLSVSSGSLQHVLKLVHYVLKNLTPALLTQYECEYAKTKFEGVYHSFPRIPKIFCHELSLILNTELRIINHRMVLHFLDSEVSDPSSAFISTCCFCASMRNGSVVNGGWNITSDVHVYIVCTQCSMLLSDLGIVCIVFIHRCCSPFCSYLF